MDNPEQKKLVQKKFHFINSIENYAKSADSNMCMENFVDIRKSLAEIQEIYPFYKGKGGIPFLYRDDTAYVDASDSHNLIIGSTGSKKTRLVVMPTVKILAYAEESMIIADPKAEVFERTAFELKKQGYQVYVINFRNPKVGDCWNPLEIPFRFFKEGKLDKAREHANDVAINLTLSEVSKKDPYWDRSAYNFLFGLIQLAFILGKNRAIVSMNDVLQLRTILFPDNESVNWEYLNIAKTDPIVYHSLLGTVNAPESTRNSILSVFDQKVSCFSYQEDLIEMMEESTINLHDIGNKKTAIYLIMPDEKTTYHQLVSLFIKQSYEYLIYCAQQTEQHFFPIRINYILDEFSNLPAIKDFPAMISAARSRNIRFSLIVQSFQQLNSKYGSDANTIKGNCTNLVFLNSREIDILEEISTLCGVQDNNKRLFTVFGLQHLNKEKGQAIILSDRLFPFLTELIDIEKFDKGIYEHLELNERVSKGYHKPITYEFDEMIAHRENIEKDYEEKEHELRKKEEELLKEKMELLEKEVRLDKKEKELDEKEYMLAIKEQELNKIRNDKNGETQYG